MTDTKDDESATSSLLRGMEELCAFFRRHGERGVAERYELLQAGSGTSSTTWGPIWTFEARNHHAAEKAAWMMLRLVDPSVVPVRHACRASLSRKTGQVFDVTEVVVVTVLPDRIQFVGVLSNGDRIMGLPFLRCGEAAVVATAMGLIPTEEQSDDVI